MLRKRGMLRMNLDAKKLNKIEEKDAKKLRKPKFETFPNGTVKF